MGEPDTATTIDLPHSAAESMMSAGLNERARTIADAEEAIRHLAVCDTRTGEIVAGWVPRPLLELIQGGGGNKSEKGGKDKDRKRSDKKEIVDYARMMEASGKAVQSATESGGANARAMLAEMTDASVKLHKRIREQDVTISELQTAITNRDALQMAANFATIERVKLMASESMGLLVAQAKERMADNENKATQAIVTEIGARFDKFTSGPIGKVIGDAIAHKMLPPKNEDAASAGGGGGLGALLRCAEKVSKVEILMESIQEIAGDDWPAALLYLGELAGRGAPEVPCR